MTLLGPWSSVLLSRGRMLDGCVLNLRTRDQDRGPKPYIAASCVGGPLAKLRLASSLLA
jgi:hypothetical protein